MNCYYLYHCYGNRYFLKCCCWNRCCECHCHRKFTQRIFVTRILVVKSYLRETLLIRSFSRRSLIGKSLLCDLFLRDRFYMNYCCRNRFYGNRFYSESLSRNYSYRNRCYGDYSNSLTVIGIVVIRCSCFVDRRSRSHCYTNYIYRKYKYILFPECYRKSLRISVTGIVIISIIIKGMLS